MKSRIGLLVLVLATVAVTRTVISQDGGSDDWKKAMAEHARLSSPGPDHKKLEPLVGTFDASSKTWFDPAKPPLEAKGVCVNASICGGRFVEQRYKGAYLGQPYEGLGIIGFDNTKKKYTSTWVDTASTSVTSAVGTWDEKAGGIVAHGDVADSRDADKLASIRTVLAIKSADEHVYEMFVGSGEREYKVLEITYTRKK